MAKQLVFYSFIGILGQIYVAVLSKQWKTESSCCVLVYCCLFQTAVSQSSNYLKQCPLMHGIVALLSDGAISFPLFAEGNVSESCNNALTMYFDETFPAGYCYGGFVVV